MVNCKHNSTDKEINAYSTIIVVKLMITTTDDAEILHLLRYIQFKVSKDSVKLVKIRLPI